MKEGMSFDYLPQTDIYIYQRKDMFRINTDTALLGGFMKINEQDRVLDIGTNNGALLLYANRFHPSFLYGVEIQKEACELAEENMRYHNITNYRILHEDIQHTHIDAVDVIVCNPPYFKVSQNAHINESKALCIARHEIYLNLNTLLQSVQRLLKENGRFYMVHRSDRIADILCGLRNIQMEAKRIQFVYDEYKDTARSVLIEAVRHGKSHCSVLPPHVITR